MGWMMFDLMVVARGGEWVLVDDVAGELGAFSSRAEALLAARDYEARIDDEASHVLIQDCGEWEEAVIEPPSAMSSHISA